MKRSQMVSVYAPWNKDKKGAAWNHGKKWPDEIKEKISQSTLRWWQEHPEESLRKQRT
ncbi:MAG: hypothetical protein ACRD8Z_16240 [Nitrososphaeraceae archaeon]